MMALLKQVSFAVTLAATFCIAANASAAPISGSDVIAVDFASAGGSATNFNVINSNTTITAGNVILYNGGTVVDGVSLTLTGATGFNDDGNANGWTGQTADPYYVEAANDLAYASNTSAPITLTFSGLDDLFNYNVRVYSLFGRPDALGRTETFTITDGAGTVGSTLDRATRWNASTLAAGGTVWEALHTDGSGNLSVSIAGDIPDNPFVNAIVLEATVPEPSMLAMGSTLGLMGLLGIAVRSRRKRRTG